jgi:hypothetical protein
MRSLPAIDVPPNFITMRAIGGGKLLCGKAAALIGTGHE